MKPKLSAQILISLLVGSVVSTVWAKPVAIQPDLSTRLIPIIERDGYRFRDLNRNGTLDTYEDWRVQPDLRSADLLSKMTLEEKAGLVMHGNFPELAGERGLSTRGYDLPVLRTLVLEKSMTSFLTRLSVTPLVMAEQNNLAQEIAEEGRLGIPLTVSTDPRHHFLYITGQSSDGKGFSRWPETLGFAAIGDVKLVETFADIARREYRATGIQQALSPQVDLYTEPRWARGYGGFGSSPMLSRDMARAYVKGFQGGLGGIGKDSVMTTIKHWVAYGATVNGLDAHNAYGQISRVSNRSFRMQIEPFLGGFDAAVAAVMPTYSIIEGTSVNGKPLEHVAAGYNKQLLTELLRQRYGFKGIILSDWAITNDCPVACSSPTADEPQGRTTLGMPWGVERLGRPERFAKAMNAGVDQFGGVAEPDQIVAAVKQGLITVARLDASVRRLLEAKFRLGLFESPFVNEATVTQIVNPPSVAALASRAQAEAQVLLQNKKSILPLKAGTRVFSNDLDPDRVRAAGLVPVANISLADVALVRVDAPYEKLHPYHFIGSRQHEGRLDFQSGNVQLAEVERLSRQKPVIAALFLDRPAIVTPLQESASAILVNFGVSDEALLAALTGRILPRGRLPFELPSSMQAVADQNPSLPDDSRSPLYRAGFGLIWKH